ncbi:calcium-binding protein [Paracoccus aminovorans]|uniref:calcium-binding protein n=1 Tax=Paracoccus aminovorans TaxID=34004 RepID=UPI000780E798|nr:calcium-binding protein [Paracoccus aminovorans]MDQ7776683.1 calcium-binding protein [Paracoccus aminovorans]
MAIITLRQGQGAIRDMTLIDWSQVLGFARAGRSAMQLRLFDDASNQAVLTGSGLAYGGGGPGGLRAGMVQELRITRVGQTVFEAAGLVLSAAALADAYARSDDGAVTRLLMAGADVLRATDLAETLAGYAGADTILGMGGSDKIFGGAGGDRLLGGAGDDTLLGEAGDDLLSGGIGHDTLYGDAGKDTLSGDAGKDTLSGEAGNDALYGGDGNDRLLGGAGADSLYAGNGADLAYGGDGADRLYGEAGNDSLFGGNGNDWSAPTEVVHPLG